MTKLKKTNLCEEGIPGFEWPDCISERERIKRNTTQFKSLEIPEAFERFYGVKVNKAFGLASSQISNVKVGDIVNLAISSITRRCTEFNSPLFRENVISSVNLYQYPYLRDNFKHISTEIPCKVVAKDEQQIKVDPTMVLYENWLGRILKGIKSQYSIKEDRHVTIHNLQLHKSPTGKGGGFIGALRIDDLSDFLGEDVFIKVFIPGSQIVLNIERDFDSWIGSDVEAFVSNYIPENEGTGLPTIVCSRKNYLIHQGNMNKIDIFNEYCLDSKAWETYKERVYSGVVTGIINSSKTCGVFVEVPSLNITGMVKVASDEITKYHPGDEVKVHIKDIEEPMYYNQEIGQMQHINSVVMDGDIIKSCKLNFIFDFA